METGDDYTCLMVEGRPVGGAFPPQMDGIPPHWDVYFNVEDSDATVARAVELGAQRAGAAVRRARRRPDRDAPRPAGRAARAAAEPADDEIHRVPGESGAPPLNLQRASVSFTRYPVNLVTGATQGLRVVLAERVAA